jgi:hypothetical protein
MRSFRCFALASSLWAFAACDSPTAGLAGVWEGTAAGGILLPGGMTFHLTLTETEFGVVSGAGHLSLNDDGIVFNNGLPVLPVTVTGAHTFPSVSLHIAAGGLQPMNFQATLDNGLAHLSGVLNGSGFLGTQLQLTRVVQSPLSRITGP